jgi:germination protein M
MKRLIVMVLALAVLGAGCAGADGAGSFGDAEPTGTEATVAPSPVTTPEGSTEGTTPGPAEGAGETVTYEVWFTNGERLFVTKRTQEATQAVGAASIGAMLAGPGAEETSVGVGTQVPAGTEMLDLFIADGLATVDLSGDFEVGGGSASAVMRIAQVVYTLTQFPSVEAVNFRIDGQDVAAITNQGIVNEPVDRSDFEDLLPAILVESPTIGETVSSPVAIAGSANVFEATVSLRILDENGDEIALDFTTATCGTGCRGTYEGGLEYEVDREQRGTVEAFESSAEDGRPINVVSIPVILTP